VGQLKVSTTVRLYGGPGGAAVGASGAHGPFLILIRIRRAAGVLRYRGAVRQNATVGHAQAGGLILEDFVTTRIPDLVPRLIRGPVAGVLRYRGAVRRAATVGEALPVVSYDLYTGMAILVSELLIRGPVAGVLRYRGTVRRAATVAEALTRSNIFHLKVTDRRSRN
jgi:hypothetical protein